MKKILISILLASVLLASCETFDSSNNAGTISVSGSSTVYMEADMASFTVSAEATRETSEEARIETDRIITEAVNVLLEKYGVEKEDIKTNYLSLNPEYSYVDNQRVLVGQHGYQSIDVALHNISVIGSIVEDLSKINGISVSSIILDKSNKESEIDEARRLAVEDAMNKANTYAEALGRKVVSVVSLTSGSSPSYMNSTLRLEAAAMPVAKDESYSTEFYSYELSVSDSVSLVFRIE